MPTYSITYDETYTYEVILDADSEDEARLAVTEWDNYGIAPELLAWVGTEVHDVTEVDAS